ncbi:MAG: MFS transporter [Acidobacteriaceae bacterium]
MKSARRLPPVWLMGLSNSTLGLNTGIVFFAMPQLLAAQHVPEARIAGITAAAMSANFWGVAFGPMLDVRFSRRWYATCLAVGASIMAAVAVLNLHRLVVLEAALVLGVAAGMLSTAALGGWLSAVCPDKDKNKLSAWMNIAAICGIGVASAAGGELVRHLPSGLAATLIGSMLLLPAAIFLIIPAPGPDRRLAGESFRQFSRELLALLRRRQVLIALLLFVTPCSSFALTDILGGLGGDFHASARVVSMAGGMGAFLPGIIGCLLFPIIAKRLPLRFFYLANGMLGCLFTLTLVLLPRTPGIFVLALLGEYLFQAVAFSIQIGVTFETIGWNNPLAATTFTFLTTATNIPVTYMMVADGRGYSMAGVTGCLAMDGVVGIATCLLLGWLLYRHRGRGSTSYIAGADPLLASPQED